MTVPTPYQWMLVEETIRNALARTEARTPPPPANGVLELPRLGHEVTVCPDGKAALKALEQSTDVWEANLVCARVLQRHRQFAAAEDAVLRNLDVGLEQEQSRRCLSLRN